MADPFVGQLLLVGFNFAPKGYAFTQGQIMGISSNTALFSLLGTYYGGDGRTTFGLPNLQGSVAVGMGQSPGTSLYQIGETGGTPTVTLNVNQVPGHSHGVQGAAASANQLSPVGHAPGDTRSAGNIYSTSATPLAAMSGAAISTYGSGGSHNNLMPYLTLNWVIALSGVYPTRS
jgi:microcystin-dependent protein